MAARGSRILVVDDNEDSAEVLELLLRQMGADVQVASSGQSAMLALEAYRPSVVLLDIDLPDMNGHELARRIRSGLDGGGLTLIALTGWSGADDIQRSREAGIDHHLVKPLDLGLLTTVLEDLPKGRTTT